MTFKSESSCYPCPNSFESDFESLTIQLRDPNSLSLLLSKIPLKVVHKRLDKKVFLKNGI